MVLQPFGWTCLPVFHRRTPQQVEGSVILKTGTDASRFWGGISLGLDLTGQGISYVTVENLQRPALV